MKRIAVLFLLSAGFSAQAQIYFTFSRPDVQQSVFNPAQSGQHGSINIAGLFRNQWSGLEGAPTQQSISGDFPIEPFNMGFSAGLFHETMGQLDQLKFHVSGSYKRVFSFGELLGGLMVNYRQLQLKGAELRAPQGDYEGGIAHNDPHLSEQNRGDGKMNFSLGVAYRYLNYEIGVAYHDILKTGFELGNPESGISVRNNRSLLLMAGATQKIIEDISVNPMVLYILESGLQSIQLLISFVYLEKYHAASGTRFSIGRSMESIYFSVGVELKKKWKVVYAYDLGTNALSTVNGGSHELGLIYRLKTPEKSPASIIHNPRFLNY